MKLMIKPKSLSFNFVFFLVFCFSGILSAISILSSGINYRNGIIISFIILPLLVYYKIKIRKVFLAFIALGLVIGLSAFFNQSSLTETIYFARNIIFSFLIFVLVDLYIQPGTIARVIKLCTGIAMIQLPLVVLEQSFYEQLPNLLQAKVAQIDIGIGTFDIGGDASMGFFLVLLIIFLLFDTKHNYIIKYKWFILLWLTLTIFIANAELLKVLVVFIWVVYFIFRFKIQNVIFALLIFVLIVGVLSTSHALDETWDKFSRALIGNLNSSSEAREKFLSGGYARGAALVYYLDQGANLLGDGPSRYFDPITRKKEIGNTGHIFTFYSEIGLLGWILSIFIFFLMAFPIKQGRLQFSWTILLYFLAIQTISITTSLMDNTAVILIYCIMVKTYLIPDRQSFL